VLVNISYVSLSHVRWLASKVAIFVIYPIYNWYGWWRGVVASVVRGMNEVTLRRPG